MEILERVLKILEESKNVQVDKEKSDEGVNESLCDYKVLFSLSSDRDVGRFVDKVKSKYFNKNEDTGLDDVRVLKSGDVNEVIARLTISDDIEVFAKSFREDFGVKLVYNKID